MVTMTRGRDVDVWLTQEVVEARRQGLACEAHNRRLAQLARRDVHARSLRGAVGLRLIGLGARLAGR